LGVEVKKGIIFVWAVLACASLTHAQSGPGHAGLLVTKTLHGEYGTGENITVNITVRNPAATKVDVYVEEILPPYVLLINPAQPKYHDWPEDNTSTGFRLPYLSWNLSVVGDSEKSLYYTIALKQPGAFFSYTTKVRDDQGTLYESNVLRVNVSCKIDGVCNKSNYENYRTCPEDCLSGLPDDVCDRVRDSRHDPDCAYGFDPDYNPDLDYDGDGVKNRYDVCPRFDDKRDRDRDGTPDGCDADDDNDSIHDDSDNCRLRFNPGQKDRDLDGKGDRCDFDWIRKVKNFTANQTTLINATDTAHALLKIRVKQKLINAEINLSHYHFNPKNKSFGVPGLDKYLEINVSKEVNDSLSSVFLSLYYTDEEVNESNLNESTLAFHWFNESAEEWVRLNATSMSWVYGEGVNVTEDFVWANVSHLSTYTLGGETLSIEREIALSIDWNLISLPLNI